jgi:hypothetical protein
VQELHYYCATIVTLLRKERPIVAQQIRAVGIGFKMKFEALFKTKNIQIKTATNLKRSVCFQKKVPLNNV